jgi:hypothetical protein
VGPKVFATKFGVLQKSITFKQEKAIEDSFSILSLTQSLPYLMQLKNVHNIFLISNNIKITLVGTCFGPN